MGGGCREARVAVFWGVGLVGLERINEGGDVPRMSRWARFGDGGGDRWFGAHKRWLGHAEDVPVRQGLKRWVVCVVAQQ